MEMGASDWIDRRDVSRSFHWATKAKICLGLFMVVDCRQLLY